MQAAPEATKKSLCVSTSTNTRLRLIAIGLIIFLAPIASTDFFNFYAI